MDLLLVLAFVTLLIVISAVDIKKMIIPDACNIAIAAIAILKIVLTDHKLLDAALGAFSGALVFILIALIASKLTGKEAMGMGDIKLICVCGLFLGLWPTILAIYLSFLIGGIIAVIVLLISKEKHREIPFGPMIALACIISLFAFDHVINYIATLLG